MFSGKITATYPPNTDVLGKKKLTFYISTISHSKEGKKTIKAITSYNLGIQDLFYFNKGFYVYLVCKLMDNNWYLLESISNNAYDGNHNFMTQIYEESKYEEEKEPENKPESKVINIKRSLGQ
jgi:hypothetical protein